MLKAHRNEGYQTLKTGHSASLEGLLHDVHQKIRQATCQNKNKASDSANLKTCQKCQAKMMMKMDAKTDRNEGSQNAAAGSVCLPGTACGCPPRNEESDKSEESDKNKKSPPGGLEHGRCPRGSLPSVNACA